MCSKIIFILGTKVVNLGNFAGCYVGVMTFFILFWKRPNIICGSVPVESGA